MSIKSAIGGIFRVIETSRSNTRAKVSRTDKDKIAQQTQKIVKEQGLKQQQELKKIRAENKDALRKARQQGKQDAYREMERNKK